MKRYFCLILMLLLTAPSYGSSDNNTVMTPKSLEMWQGWIIHSHPELNCSLGPKQENRNCQWRSPLNVVVSGKIIAFNQAVTLEKEDWISLPGEEKSWPQNVRINGKQAKVMSHDNFPALFLKPGSYDIQGKIVFSETPLALRLPSSFTFIDLKIDGKVISNPSIDNQFLLLNQVKVQPPKTSDAVDIQVFRLIKDGNPFWLETIIRLNVSGDRRIQTLGRALPEGFELSNISSDLPLRIDKDGNMEVQLDTGSHEITLSARLVSNNTSFKIEPRDTWPQEELWSFQPNRAFRIVDLNGVTIDGSQTNLPEQWKQFTSYLLKPNQGLTISEKSRGDSKPDQHKLKLERTLWLNFDGSQFTTEENLTGSLGHLDRLTAQPGYTTGRVSINNEDVLITTVNNDQGIEVLPGNININSLGQVTGNRLSINPWSTPVESASFTVHLPPGYSLFAVKGADDVSNAYLSSWNLWSIFIVILFVVILFKQYGLAAGVVGLLYALAVHKVSGAPSVIILLVVVGVHFVIQSIPENKFQVILNRVYQASLILVILSFLPFAVKQARLSIYPQLERPYQIMTEAYTLQEDHFIENEKMALQDQDLQQKPMLEKKKERLTAKRDSMSVSSSFLAEPSTYTKRYQEGVVVQTGPGMPAWNWNKVYVNWPDPVAAEQSVQMVITPPWVNRLLNLIRIALFLMLSYLFLSKQNILKLKVKTISTNLLIIGFALFFSSLNTKPLYADDFPTKELLDEYYQRLSEAPTCAPTCSAYNFVDITANPQSVKLNMTVATIAKVPVALPIDLATIRSATIKVNGQSAKTMTEEGGIAYLLLDQGMHNIEVQINTADLQQLFLNFTDIPQLADFNGSDWQVSGIDKRSVPTGRIHLRKIKKKELSQTDKRLSPDPIQPLVKVTRELNLGLDWTITTYVTRVAPSTGAINVRIPLLDGESVTTSDLKVKDKHALLDFSQQTSQKVWHSVLEKKSPIKLASKPSDYFYEVWTLNPSLNWHVSYEGLNPIKSSNNQSQLIWWPLADDNLNIFIERPTPLDGESNTIDSVNLRFEPGKRQSKTSLDLSFRASRGSDYPLALPADAEVTSIIMNGKHIIFEEEAGEIKLPIPPGKSTFNIEWKETNDFKYLSSTPELKLPKASNISIETLIPRNRWILWVSGPLIGPAILFWGVLIVILSIGFALGLQAWSPLKSWEWMLMGTGIATSFWPITILVVAWFALLALRENIIHEDTSVKRFRFIQTALGLLTVAMLLALISSVANSLMFGSPEMQITGNGSSSTSLFWYRDVIALQLPSTTVLSLPMWIYQILMLIWSIWLSTSLIRWLKWGWEKFNKHGAWKTYTSTSTETLENEQGTD